MSIHNIEWPVIYDKAQAKHLAVYFNNKYWIINGDIENTIILNEVHDKTLAGTFAAKQTTITMQQWLAYARKGLYARVAKSELIEANETVFVYPVIYGEIS